MIRSVPHQPHLMFAALAMVAIGLTSACNSQLGLQSGVLDGSTASFNGIIGATVLSPSSVQVTWNASTKFKLYKVFAAGSSTPLGQSLFSTSTLNGLTPNTNYNLSVGAIPAAGGAVFGADISRPVQTWPNFAGIGTLVASGPLSLNAVWTFPVSGPTFRVYVSPGAPPTDFTTPDLVTQGFSGGITTYSGGLPLQPSTTYYVIVRATYLDSTSDTNSNSLFVTTPSAISPLPTISAPTSILGKIATITVSGGLAGYSTSFSTGGVTLGSIHGNGQFILPSSKPLSPGPNVITATVSYLTYTATLPSFTINSRVLSTAFSEAPLMFGGKGRQTLGAVMAVGDFNCDGADDLAIAAPYGTFFNAPGFSNTVSQYTGSGGVYVFYGGGPSGLILPGQVISGVTIPNPSSSPTGKNPLFIPHPATFVSLSQLHFGQTLVAGNINGDTQTIGGSTYACDDLVISSPILQGTGLPIITGAVFIYYGSAFGIQLGTPVLNQSACSNGICSPQEIVPYQSVSDPLINTSTTSYTYFGSAMALGNFGGNGLGYHDLAVAAPSYFGDNVNNAGTANLQTKPGKVFIYRADSSGITMGTSTLGYASATIQAPANALYGNTNAMYRPVSFGVSLAALDLNGDGVDDLAVGSPSDSETVPGPTTYTYRGSVYYYQNPKTVNYPTGVGFSGANLAPTQQLQSGLVSGTYANNYMFWGGTLTKAGDINGDGIADLVVGTGFGGGGLNYWSLGTAIPQLVSVIYGGPTGPQGFAGSPAQPVTPAINANSCTTAFGGGACGTYSCGGCVVQHFTNANSWLTAPNTSYTYTGLAVAGAKTQNNAISGALVQGGQALHNCASPPNCYADILVGNPVGGTSSSGVGVALYGTKNGLGIVPSLINPSQSLPLDQTGLGTAIGLFKSQVVCPTVASAAVGSPFNSQLGNGAVGGVAYTFMPTVAGGNCLLASTSSNSTQVVKSNLSAEVPGNYDPNSSGYGLNAWPAGDLNSDGYTDIVARMYIAESFPGASTNFAHSNQVAYPGITVGIVYYGSATGINIAATPSLNPVGNQPLLLAPPTTSGCGGVGQYTCYLESMVNAFVPVGDVNGDGFADAMMVGSQGLALYFGSSSGLQHVSYPSTTSTNLDARLIPNGVLPNGASLSSLPYFTYGDFNGDGYSDLAYGSPGYSSFPNGIASGGAVAVLYGSTNGYQLVDANLIGCVAGPPTGSTWATTGNTKSMCSTNTAFFGACDGTTPGGNCVPQLLVPPVGAGAAGFGLAVYSAGDINGDGVDDLLVPSPYDSVFNGGCGTNCVYGGVAYLYYGSPRGLWVAANGQSPSILGTTTPSPYSPVMIKPPLAAAGGYFGFAGAMAAGDVNKDGYGDFLVGSPYQVVSPNLYNGGAYLFYGCGAGVGTCPNTGVWGVSYAAGPGYSTVPFSVGCSAGQLCTVKNAPSCQIGGACSPLYFSPPSTNSTVYGTLQYTGWTLGSIGDANQDGYADIMYGAGYPAGTGGSTLPSSAGYSLQTYNVGVAFIYSGSSTGLVVGTPSNQPQCLAGQGCTPYMMQPPFQDWGQPGVPEYSRLTHTQRFQGFGSTKPHQMVDFNGDGLPDFFLQYDTYWSADRKAYGQGGLIFFQ